MDSRRRAELLATLSPEGLATYEVLKAQLARDLDRSFAASKARLEKSMEMAFDDLHTKLDETIGRLRQKVRTDDGTRRAPAAAALASSTTSSVAFPPVSRGTVSTIRSTTASAATATPPRVPVQVPRDSTSSSVPAMPDSAVITDPTPISALDDSLDSATTVSSAAKSSPSATSASWVTASMRAATATRVPTVVSLDSTSTPVPNIAPAAVNISHDTVAISDATKMPTICSTKGQSFNTSNTGVLEMSVALEGVSNTAPTPTRGTATQFLQVLELVMKPPATCSTECPGGDTSAARAVLSSTAAPGRCSTEGVDKDTSVKSPESALHMFLPTMVPSASFHSSLMALADANLRCTHVEKANMFQLLNNNDSIHVSKEQDKSPLVPCLVHAIATRAASPFQLQYCCENLGMCQHPYFRCYMCAPSPWDPGRQINKLGSLVVNRNYASIVLWPSCPPDRTELSGMIPSSLLPMDVSQTQSNFQQSNLFLQDQGAWCEKQYSSCKRMICAEATQYGLESFPWYIAWLHFGLELLLFEDTDYFLAALFPTVPHEGILCHISAVIRIDGFEHSLCAIAWLLCDYIFCSSMAADQLCKDANVQEKRCYAECNSTVLHMITIDLMQWKDSLMFINFIFLLDGIPFALKMVSGKDKFSFASVPWEIAWVFYLEYSDGEGDKLRLHLHQESREGLVVNGLKSTRASIQVIIQGKKRVVNLDKQQLLILEPGASIMLLEVLPRPNIHLTLNILDVAPMNASLICLLEDIKYRSGNFPAAPLYYSENHQLEIVRSIDLKCYTIANKYMQSFFAVPLSRSIPRGHCVAVIHDLEVLNPWPPPLYLSILALSSFRGTICTATSDHYWNYQCCFQHVQWKIIWFAQPLFQKPVQLSLPQWTIAWSTSDALLKYAFLFCTPEGVPFYASEQIQWEFAGEIFKKLLLSSMDGEIFPANLIVICYSIVGVAVWSNFATGFRQTEEYFVEHCMTQCRDVGFSPSATIALLQIWQAAFVALFSSKEAMDHTWVFHCQRVCSVSAWWRDNPGSVNDACWKSGIATLQVTWDPGGSTQFWFEDKVEDWVQGVLQTPWDPGGAIQHRLGGKSNLMGEGLSATWALLPSNQYLAQPSLKPQGLQIPRGDNRHRLAWIGTAASAEACVWLCSLSSSLYCSSSSFDSID